ncbi:NAD(P)/FAD-dependent oxidoreductase [Qaidamihabitans albus]|uniref:NAD(P)/FAD-dependent oxidoreductase n=1 Tax=Qaidamihabitans albus TaxID=2795733 RepID=UPI0018F1A47A|nr:FAD-dependent oxidoreductase [Qaidamihabitans albus]
MSTVIVGAGQAGVHLAVSLRQAGYAERIVLIGDEPALPYQRPPLSKAFLLGAATEEAIQLRPESFYPSESIDLLTGERATGIDLATACVQLASGTRIAWEHLVLATGARPRTLGVPGKSLDGVLPLRSLAHARELARRIGTARHVVVVGGGFIGLEFAAAVARDGITTTLLEGADRLMGRAVTSPVSRFFAESHRARGVEVRLGVAAAEFLGVRGRVTAVRATDGRNHPADLVVVGAGVTPDTELAARAGLPTGDGILVDETLRTADERVFAIGDCARFPSTHAGTLLRLESVQNATGQAAHVAREIVAPGRCPYQALPWFWSDQKGLRLQIAGLTHRHDETALLGDPDSGRFSVAAFRNGRLVALEAVNRPADYQAARRLLSRGAALTASDVTAPGFSLKTAAA